MTYYDAIAEGYDELHGDEQLEKYRSLKQLGSIEPEETILDLGHGSGLICKVFTNPILGVDTSSALLAKSPAKTMIATFDDPLPFEDASYDWVVSFTALHHARTPEALIREARRIARRGVAVSILRSLPSYDRLASLFDGWEEHDAGADALFVTLQDER